MRKVLIAISVVFLVVLTALPFIDFGSPDESKPSGQLNVATLAGASGDGQSTQKTTFDNRVIHRIDLIYRDLLYKREAMLETNQRRKERSIEARNFYEDFLSRSYDLSVVLYSQSNNNVFAAAFYCNEAAKLYNEYKATVPDIAARKDRYLTEYNRTQLLRNELEDLDPNTLPLKTRETLEKCITFCYFSEGRIFTYMAMTAEDEEMFKYLTDHVTGYRDYSITQLNRLLTRTFFTPSNTTARAFTQTSRVADRVQAALQTTYLENPAESTFTPNPKQLRMLWVVLIGVLVACYFASLLTVHRVLIKYNNYLKQKGNTRGLEVACAFWLAAICVNVLRVFASSFISEGYAPIVQDSLALGSRYLVMIGVFMLSVLVRVPDDKLWTAVRMYVPLIALASFCLVLRMSMVPDILVFLSVPVMVTICAVASWRILLRNREELGRLDFSMGVVIVVVLTCSVYLAWVGYGFAVFLLACWLMAFMLAILFVVGLWGLVRRLGYLFGFAFDETWIEHFVKSLLVPVCGVFLAVWSVMWSAGIFNMSSLVNMMLSEPLDLGGCVLTGYGVVKIVLGVIVVNYILNLVKLGLKRGFPEDYGRGALASFVLVGSLVVWLIYVLLVFAVCEVDYNGILVVMGGMSVGIGLAMKDTLANLFSGLTLMFGRLRQGDLVECDGIRGYVKSIGYNTTQIETLDGSLITFQNSQLSMKNFRNLTKNHPDEQVPITVGVEYTCDIDKVRDVLLSAVRSVPQVSRPNEVGFRLNSFASSSLDLILLVWVPVEFKTLVCSHVRVAIYKALHEHGIRIPFPQLDLHLPNTKKEEQS